MYGPVSILYLESGYSSGLSLQENKTLRNFDVVFKTV